MIKFKSLQHTDPEIIRNCFNECFKDYFVPFQLSAEQFQNKLLAEAIDLSLSVGAFEKDELQGLILHGIDSIDKVRTAYNAGTGLLPAARGKSLSLALYEYSIDQLRKAGIEKTVLEVFQQNKAAINIYQRAGFNISRVINSYKGRPVHQPHNDFHVKEEDFPDWSWINANSAWQPAWQYNQHSLHRGWHQYRLFTAYEKDEPVAFIIFNPGNGRIAQFGAVEFPASYGHLESLFAHTANLHQQEISVAHVASAEAEDFLQSLGLQLFIYSYEMERSL